MKKILYVLSLLLLCLVVTVSFSGKVYGQEQSVDLTLTIKAKAVPELEQLIKEEKEKQRDHNNYTESSWETYQKALEKAEEVLKSTSYDEERVAAALIELQKAVHDLTPRQKANVVVPMNTTKPVSKAQTTTSKYPPTGMSVELRLVSFGLLLVGAASFLWKSIRRKEKRL